MWVFCQTVKCIKRKERCKRFFFTQVRVPEYRGRKTVDIPCKHVGLPTYMINLTYSVKKLDYLIPKYSCNWILSHRPLHKNILPMHTSFLYQPPVDQCWFVAWSMYFRWTVTCSYTPFLKDRLCPFRWRRLLVYTA